MPMTNLRQKILEISTAILAVLAMTALAGFAVIYFGAQNYLNKNLAELVEKKSKGKYELTFENLEINFSRWGIEINQVSFHPSDSIINTLKQNVANKQFYSFSSPNISLSGIQLIQLIFRKKLEIGEILIAQPQLNIHGKQQDPDNKENNVNTLLQELRPLVTKTFRSIKIGKIELVNASYDFYNLLGDTKKMSNAENITIGILDFYTDSLLLPDQNRLFETSDIYLRMEKYQNKLADSIHTISAESVTYSLKRSVIEAKNIELKPINQSTSIKSKYYFFIPKARITTTHIKEFYRNNSIPIDSLILTDARIKYWPGQKRVITNLEPSDEFNLNDLIRNEFSGITIQDFRLKNAQVKIFRSQADTATQQELKNIALNLTDFRLDSISQTDTSRVFYAKNIDFAASGYELTLGDNIHRIKAGNLELSTKERSALVKNIQVYPVKTSNSDQKNTIDGTCDSVRLDLFNFKKAYHEKRFAFQRINIFNPEVKLTQNTASKEKFDTENTSFIYKLISGYVKGIYANQVVVKKGNVHLVNKTGVIQTGNIESAIKLQLSGFALDEVSVRRTDRLFFANQIELDFSNYQMHLADQLHKLTIDNLSISTQKKLAKLQNLHLFPVSKENMEELLKQYSRSELYEFTIPELSLSDADFHNAFFNKKLSVDTLSIKTPQIYYENFALLKQLKPKPDFEDLFRLISNYLDNIHINTLTIPDGTVRLINHSKKDKTTSLNNRFSLKLENMQISEDQFNKKRLLFSEYVDFSVRDHLIRLSDNVHVLKAGEIGFSTRRQEIFAVNATLYPETTSKDFSSIAWNIQLAIPEIRIKGINIESFYFDHKIDADNLTITSPDIKLYQKRKKTDSKEIKEITFPLPKEIESIAVRKFTLNDGSLKVFSEIGTKPYLMVQSDIKMAAQNLLIQKNGSAGNPEFKTGEYTGNLIQFKFTPKDKNQQFSIDELTFSTSDRRILARNLAVSPKVRNNKEDQFELNIPSLAMNGFDIDNAYKNDQFTFESIVVDKPTFQLSNNAKDSLKFNPFTINLYPHFESFADVFSSKLLNVNDANITVYKNGQKKLQEKISFNLTKIRIENKPSQGFMHSSDFSFRIPNLKRQGKLYQFSIGETSYSSINNRFVAKDIRIIPNFSRADHQKKVGFQSDYFSGKIDSVSVSQPNIKRWFDKEELAGKYMSVNGLNLDVYRDKQLPFDETRRPKMLQDLIKSLKVPLSVDSLILTHSQVSYSEKKGTDNLEGKIRFTDIHARILPFTNMKAANGAIPDFNLYGSATIQDSCQLKVSMNYLMNHPENKFTAKGSLSPFNMRILNPILEPLAMISIRSGKVNQFKFDFLANQTSANGQLFFGYDNLKISVLAMKDGNTKDSRFASFLANSLLLRSKNPRGKELLPDEIAFQRDQKRSVLNYWWKSIFSGIKNTLDIKDNKTEESK
jgi:hypothetical protein